jgi:hypothetical protein
VSSLAFSDHNEGTGTSSSIRGLQRANNALRRVRVGPMTRLDASGFRGSQFRFPIYVTAIASAEGRLQTDCRIGTRVSSTSGHVNAQISPLALFPAVMASTTEIAQCLGNTLNPDINVRRAAELKLGEYFRQPGMVTRVNCLGHYPHPSHRGCRSAG